MPLTDLLGDNQLEKMLALDDALKRLTIPYAFGGAIALGYYVEPRATSDFDVNVFCTDAGSPPVLDRLRAERLDEAMRSARTSAPGDGDPVSGG